MDLIFKAERDAIATLGLLAVNALEFDLPIPLGEGRTTHWRGFNVHCCVIDNHDGEVLALERNCIHSQDDPLQHAEQRALRAAITRIHAKRPRPGEKSVEEYYKSLMFMEPGKEPGDFLRKGCTLYNTFDPCAMCAVTLLIAYMKRIAYVFEDAKFARVYGEMKTAYFSSRESLKERVTLSGGSSRLIDGTRTLLEKLDARMTGLRANRVELVHVLDHCRSELEAAAGLLRDASSADLITRDKDLESCRRTLADFQRACHFPVH